MAWRERAAEKLLSTSRVTISLHNVKYVFTETEETWQQMLWEDTVADNQAEATQSWKKAELPPGSVSAEWKTEAEVVAEEEDAAIGNAMAASIRKDLKWTLRELQDALVTAGVSVQLVPSMRNYVAALHAQYGVDTTYAFRCKRHEEVMWCAGRILGLGALLEDSNKYLD